MSRLHTTGAVLRSRAPARPYDVTRPLVLERLTLAAPEPGEVLVRVTAAGLCHSDLSVIDGTRARPLPMLLGHEAVGEVLELGSAVRDLAVGDQVVCTFVPSCGSCLSCAVGRPALCEQAAAANGAGELLEGGSRLRDGNGALVHHHLGVSAFSEYAVVSRRSLVRIDHAVSPQIAALFGCAVMTGVGAIANTAALRLGETVLVTGLGGIGFAAVLGALAGGASTVVAADVSEGKLALARTLGAQHTVNVAHPQAIEHVRDLTHGGVDIGLEAAGTVAALEFTHRCTRRGGRTVAAGLPHPEQQLGLAPVQLVAEERTLQGSYLGGCVPLRDIPAYIRLYQRGRLPVDRLLTYEMPLADINTGFERLAAGEAIRQVVRC